MRRCSWFGCSTHRPRPTSSRRAHYKCASPNKSNPLGSSLAAASLQLFAIGAQHTLSFGQFSCFSEHVCNKQVSNFTKLAQKPAQGQKQSTQVCTLLIYLLPVGQKHEKDRKNNKTRMKNLQHGCILF
mmetsp:Transcript_102981/g.177679  ORF Transcript_102981/g.177679 Transcript_102981/m.177679 type:complete len:128 (-) Transcript_102981:89-472(-)